MFSAPIVKHISLELVGNKPGLVLKDADMDMAAQTVVMSGHQALGQTCMCMGRVLVHENRF